MVAPELREALIAADERGEDTAAYEAVSKLYELSEDERDLLG
jgi:hypothetical protein